MKKQSASTKPQEPIVIFTDGAGANANGIAGIAWVRRGSKPFVEWGANWTNNEAEYLAILAALKALPRGVEVTVCSDSSLVIRQLRGEFQIRDVRLWDLESEIATLISNNYLKVIWRWIPRKENKADMLLRNKPASLPVLGK